MLQGKRGVILGVANNRSIAWAIAQACAKQGARLAFTVQNDRLRERVEPLVEEIPGSLLVNCDVAEEDQIKESFAQVERELGGVDFVVHSIAFAQKEDLEGEFLKVSREGYTLAQEVSAYSLVAVAREAAPLLEKAGNGSIITLSYLGAERAIPNYNVMGVAKAALESCVRYLALDLGPKAIRVNAISAGPISTLAARGISGFTDILKAVRERAPLKRNVDAEDVGNTAAFLASDLSRGITGEVIYVDAGYNIVGM